MEGKGPQRCGYDYGAVATLILWLMLLALAVSACGAMVSMGKHGVSSQGAFLVSAAALHWVPPAIRNMLATVALVVAYGAFYGFFGGVLSGFLWRYARALQLDEDGVLLKTFWGSRLRLAWAEVRQFSYAEDRRRLLNPWGAHLVMEPTAGRAWRISDIGTHARRVVDGLGSLGKRELLSGWTEEGDEEHEGGMVEGE